MNNIPQLKIPAAYMRGGTSKGVFFSLNDLPASAQSPGAVRDAILLRVIGSPDPYRKHIDGMGGATSSTSKVVIISSSSLPDHDVDYLFGQVAIDQTFIDWSGNCGNLTAAVAGFAITKGLIAPDMLPAHGVASVRIWQANIQKTIVAHVPIQDGQVQETGGFELDGVSFPAAEIGIDFLSPAEGSLFPTGNLVDQLQVPGLATLSVTMINAGIPTIIVDAHEIGYTGCELQDDVNQDLKALQLFETIRALGAIKMGLIQDIEQARQRQHTPKIAFIAPSKDYTSSSGKLVKADEIDLLVRALSMGKLHQAMMGTAAVSIACAAVTPGTIVNRAAGGGQLNSVCFGHPSGTLRAVAEVHRSNDQWTVSKVSMSRSARILMEGWVRIPDVGF